MMKINAKNIDVVNIIKLIPKDSIGAEIGVWQGNTSKLFIDKLSPKMLHMVDPWAVSGYQEAIDANDETFDYQKYLENYSKQTKGKTEKHFTKYYDNVYTEVKNKFANIKNAKIWRMTSTQWFRDYDGEKLDWIYIDGDHSYTGVINDLNNCLQVLKPDALIFGDDYKWDSNADKGGVKKAVNEFVENHNAKLKKIGKTQFRIIL